MTHTNTDAHRTPKTITCDCVVFIKAVYSFARVRVKGQIIRNKTGNYTCHGLFGKLPSSPALPEGTARSGGYCYWLVRPLLDELLVSRPRNNAGREADQ